MYKKFLLLVLLFSTLQTIVKGQQPRIDVFPKQSHFPSLLFDSKESRTYLSMAHPLSEDILEYTTYVPFALGFKKGLLRWKNTQITMDIGAHTQFGWRRENNKFKQGVRRSHLNTDYILGLSLEQKITKNLFARIRAFHQSSHLGDDYVLYYSIPRSGYWAGDISNYEQFDLTFIFDHRYIKSYAGIGSVITPATVRKRMVYQLGAYVSDFPPTLLRPFVFGFDVKYLQQNNYRPMLKYGTGIKIKKENPIYLMLEYYTGNLPYSRYESEVSTSWVGVSIYFESLL